MYANAERKFARANKMRVVKRTAPDWSEWCLRRPVGRVKLRYWTTPNANLTRGVVLLDWGQTCLR